MKPEKRLNQILARLPKAAADSLLDYAEFLDSKHGSDPVPSEPVDIPRPQTETVVEAIKRLTDTFPMLDTAHLLHETGDLMTQHIMQARPAAEVIDELEVLFRKHFDKLSANEHK